MKNIWSIADDERMPVLYHFEFADTEVHRFEPSEPMLRQPDRLQDEHLVVQVDLAEELRSPIAFEVYLDMADKLKF